ncbi:MAG TPA: sulfatase-like hydrolase/transferase, partial [Candidatus Binatia bacterium]|nr:sulfatase-like hydrolase/transferase [Candidatus Binatia bacterium]
MSKPLVYRDGEPFPGRVAASFGESVPAWPVPARAPAGAPNVVMIVLDDVGFAQIGCFGSDIDTPCFDRLAADGLRYRNFHTTAMCSPTRACLLTGRNHHTCAMGGITDLCMGFPGYNGRI